MSELDLEKGFNEAELEDIMSEIESLEKDFGDIDGLEDAVEDVETLSEAEVEAPVMEEEVPEEVDAKQEMESMLESEFGSVEETSPSEDLAVDPTSVEKTAIQSEIEDEVEAIFDESVSDEPLVEEPVAEHVEEQPKFEEPIFEEPVSEQKDFESSMPEGEVVEMSAVEKPVAMASGHETKMEFSVAGDMKLKLNFWVNGQSISLHVDEEEGFCIEMEGGAKFSLPVGKKAA